jgi:hypothetical protein
MRFPLYYTTKDKTKYTFYTLIFGIIIAAAHVYFVYTGPLQLNKGCVVVLCLFPPHPIYLKIIGNICLAGFYTCSSLLIIELYKFKKQHLKNTNIVAKEENDNISKVFTDLYL